MKTLTQKLYRIADFNTQALGTVFWAFSKKFLAAFIIVPLFTQPTFAGVCSFNGDTTISANCEGGVVASADSTIVINSGVVLNLASSDLTVNDGVDIAAFTNNGTINGGSAVQNFRAYRGNDIGAFTNNGAVTLNGTQAFYIYNEVGDHGTFSNTGTWNSNGVQSFYSAFGTTWTSFTNSGSFSANGNGSLYLHGAGSITTFTNSGTLTTDGNNSFTLDTGYTITNFVNSGTWALGTAGAAISGTIVALTNTGTITGTLKNLGGTITTFNNDGVVAYQNDVPVNYNVIVNSASDFGKVTFTQPTGALAFGISSGSSVTDGQTYAGVLAGLAASNLSATSGPFKNTGGQSFVWTLKNSSGSTWDLVVDGDSDGDGVANFADAYPNDPTRSVAPVPVMSALGFFLLVGLLGVLGIRRLRA